MKVADLKPIQKKLKGDQALALKLYATGNGDAQYMAGMIKECVLSEELVCDGHTYPKDTRLRFTSDGRIKP